MAPSVKQAPLDVACPVCEAQVGEHCRTEPIGDIQTTHGARYLIGMLRTETAARVVDELLPDGPFTGLDALR